MARDLQFLGNGNSTGTGDDDMSVPDDDTQYFTIASVLSGGLADQGGVTTFYRLLNAAGLIEFLETDMSLTLFAPSNDAFATVELPEDDADWMRNLFLLHMLVGPPLFSADMMEGQGLTMANTEVVTITSIDPLIINENVAVTATDLVASNGIIHIIDTVLIPQAGSTNPLPLGESNTTAPFPSNGTNSNTPTPATYNGTVGSPTPAPTPGNIYIPSPPTTVVTPQPGTGGQNGTDTTTVVPNNGTDPNSGGSNGTDVIGPGGINETDPYAPTSAPAMVGSPTLAPVTGGNMDSPTIAPVTGSNMGSPTLAPINSSNMGSPTLAPNMSNMGSPTLAPITGGNMESPTQAPIIGNINSPSSPTTNSPIPASMPSGTVWDTISSLDDVSEFKSALETVNMNLLLMDVGQSFFTVFAPVDTAVQSNQDFQFYLDNVILWNEHLTEILANHMLAGNASSSALLQNELWADVDPLTDDDLYFMQSFGYQPIKVDIPDQLIGGHPLLQTDLVSTNGVVHLVDGMLSMEQFSQNLIQLLENWNLMNGAAPITQRRLQGFTSTQNPFSGLLDSLDGTSLITDGTLTERSASGVTFLAPTNAALEDARIEVDNEILKYHVLSFNVYKGNVGLVSTDHPTADMWVTINGGNISFNGVQSHNTVLGQNGVLYVMEEVLRPPNMVEMLYNGAVYSNLNVSTTTGLLANAWSFGDVLSENNDASRFTFLAPVDIFWISWVLSIPAAEELLLRLNEPLWAPHTRDLFLHSMLTTAFSREELADLASDGIVQLPTLAGTNITLQLSQNGQITIGDGIILDPSMRATDGVIHMVTSMILPPSLTNTIFELIMTSSMNDNLANLLDGTPLAQNLSSMSPVTFFVPPDASLAGIKLSNLESHIFQDLYYASKLMEMDGQVITSINRKRWVVSILDGSIFLQSEGSESVVAKVQAPGEILGNNGILHSIDALLDITQAPTASPSTNPGPTGVGSTASNQTSSPSIATTNPVSNNSNITSPMPSPNSTITPTLSPSGNLTIVRVNTSFILYNTDGLKAQEVSQPEHANILNMAFSDFVESLVTDVEGQRQSQPPRNLRVAWRRLTAALQPNSPSVFAVRDIVCSSEKTPPIPNNASCQNLYGRFDLAVSDEDPEIVQATYINATNQALDNGKLQDALEKAAPTSPFVVVGKGPTEEEINSTQTIPPEDAKMDWWMILIIVLSCVLGCCCIAGSAMVFFMSNKKPEDDALVERLMDTDETPPDKPPKDPNEDQHDNDSFDEVDDDEDYPLDEPMDSEQWRQHESVNEVQADEITSRHDGETQNEWEDELDDSYVDNDKERTLPYVMPTSVGHVSDNDPDNVGDSAFQDEDHFEEDDDSAMADFSESLRADPPLSETKEVPLDGLRKEHYVPTGGNPPVEEDSIPVPTDVFLQEHKSSNVSAGPFWENGGDDDNKNDLQAGEDSSPPLETLPSDDPGLTMSDEFFTPESYEGHETLLATNVSNNMSNNIAGTGEVSKFSTGERNTNKGGVEWNEDQDGDKVEELNSESDDINGNKNDNRQP